MINLHIERLTKNFGLKKVIKDLSLTYTGTILGIAGANGSGKSTLLKCLGGLLTPTKGHIEWRKADQPLPEDTFRMMLGYAAPYINLYEELNCKENLSFLSKVRHIQKTVHINQWLEKVQLAKMANQPFGKLSTGQQQRLRLASALFHEPDILLLDEPGSNLDQSGRMLVADIVQSYRTPEKLLIIASNDRQELALCETIFSIEKQQFL